MERLIRSKSQLKNGLQFLPTILLRIVLLCIHLPLVILLYPIVIVIKNRKEYKKCIKQIIRYITAKYED